MRGSRKGAEHLAQETGTLAWGQGCPHATLQSQHLSPAFSNSWPHFVLSIPIRAQGRLLPPVPEGSAGPERMSGLPAPHIFSMAGPGADGAPSLDLAGARHLSGPLPFSSLSSFRDATSPSTFPRYDPRRHCPGIQEILAADGGPHREGQQQLGKTLVWCWRWDHYIPLGHIFRFTRKL